MQKRPTSITVIAIVLLVFTLLGVVGLVTAASNAEMTKVLAQMHMSLPVYEAYGALGIIINLACVYGIWKGLPGRASSTSCGGSSGWSSASLSHR